MQCPEAMRYVHPFLDDELDVARNLEVLTHLNLCVACQQAFETEKRIGRAVREAVASDGAPEAVKDRLRFALRREPAGAGRRRLWAALSAAAAVVLAAAAFLIATGTGSPALAEAVIRRAAEEHRLNVDGRAPNGVVAAPEDMDWASQGVPFTPCRHRFSGLGCCAVDCRASDGPEAGCGRIAWTVSCGEREGKKFLVTHGALKGRGIDLEGLVEGRMPGESRVIAGKRFYLFDVGDCRVLATRCWSQICVFVVRKAEPVDAWDLAAAAVTH